ncbi:hypothetical protein ACM66B_002849 [Microbotryomycetes sp. NB124-2]
MSNLDQASTPNTLPSASHQPSAQVNGARSSPVHSRQTARTISGHHTEVTVQAFVDRVLVVVTQLGRIGCILQVNPPPPGLPTPIHSARHSLFPQLPPPHPSSTTVSLFGIAPSPKAEMLHELYASQIGAIVFATAAMDDEMVGVPGLTKPVVLGIALKHSVNERGTEEEETLGVTDEERDTFGQVMDMVKECRVW